MQKFLIFIFVLTSISCSPLSKYMKLPEVIAWENDIKKFEQQDLSEKDPDNAILFAGSSSIRLWSSIKEDMAPYPVIQRGFGGAKISDLAVYSERIISPHPCKAIVMFIANDISGTDKDKSPEEVAKLFRILIKSIRKSHPKTPVFWIAITPTKARWEVWPQARKANELIKQYCDDQKNTYFINTEPEFLNDSGQPKVELFVSDLLHLNQNGYALWSDIIKRELNKVISPEKAEIIAHRGASYLAPENTVASAILAWELGADAVEADIYLSKDNKIMVNHDATTKRTTGKNFTIKETSSDTLRTLDAGSFKSPDYKGEKIPFLEEIINTIPKNKELVIEIKCKSEVLPYLQEIINNSGKDKKFAFISFDINTITDTKRAFPENSCYWLCSNAELLSKNIGLVTDAGLDGISLSYPIIDEKIAELTRKLNLELFSWTVDDPDEAKRLISLGVKGITTNRPGWLNKEIQK